MGACIIKNIRNFEIMKILFRKAQIHSFISTQLLRINKNK